MARLAPVPPWLTTATILATSARTKGEAWDAYRHFVLDGIGTDSVWGALKHQIYLGDEPFIERMQRSREDAHHCRAYRAQGQTGDGSQFGPAMPPALLSHLGVP